LVLVLAGQGADAALAGPLREMLLSALPNPLFKDEKHWGKQKAGLNGKLRNEGRWWKLRVEGRDFPHSVKLAVRDARPAGADRKAFTVDVEMMANLLLERQTWRLGMRLYSGSTRARLRLRLTMDCEAQTRFETPPGGLLPEAVIRLRVVRSDFRYDKPVVEHTAGVGGDAAKIAGEAMLAMARLVKPDLERKLIDKANAAVLKAGDTKEVRLSLAKLFSGKK
ncbi:MAG: hypothetical protein K2W96_28640, partial [Gemmataceae bacterium]|nr:hypothetical protein [Gemmataceae bacterium]